MALEAKVNAAADLSTIICGKCGGIYAIAERYRQFKQDNGGFWRCPYCECSWGYGTSEIEKLQKTLDLERKRTEWAKQEAKNAKHQNRALKGQVTKIKNRVGNGVCPCCNRTFENLHRHMKIKHPEYTEQK